MAKRVFRRILGVRKGALRQSANVSGNCMCRYAITFIIFLSPFKFLFGQSADVILAKNSEQLGYIVQWFQDRSKPHSSLDSITMNSLKDGGRFENNHKIGVWREFTIDSSLMGVQTNVSFGNRTSQITFDAKIIKSVGEYSNGQRNGLWTEYTTDNVRFPFYWRRRSEINFKNGLKDGKEILYQGYLDQSPLIVRSWSGGVESGVGEVYDSNFPYALRQRTITSFRLTLISETYYPSGHLESTFIDSFADGIPMRFMRQYHERGYLIRTGFYSENAMTGKWVDYYPNGTIQCISNFSNGKLDGKYEYFYDNGQLWTERIYAEGKLISVNSNYTKDGFPQASGTIKDGTGIVFLYDEQGKLTKTIFYENGEEKHNSH